MDIFGKLKSFVKKEKKTIPREEVLASKPLRNPLIKWELQENGDVQMVIPLKKSLRLTVLSYLFHVPARKTVVLDRLGSEVWLRCDGETSVSQIVDALCEKHKMSRKESEISLFSYLQQLVRRGYIGLQMKGVEVENPTIVKKS